ncbi:MAG: DUF4212 domain-containing protein [Bacteroidales bacterium]|jgi:uncharacterized membrane protein|nr:DUF4212 domain-containing protein [Bacteroidales bacterium]
MESTDQYNFSIFSPRNRHGRKNRNVIFTMLAIWAVAVFGFQILLRVIEKPVPEPALGQFEEQWAIIASGNEADADYRALLNSLVMVRGKITVTEADKLLLSDAITASVVRLVPDSVMQKVTDGIGSLKMMHEEIKTLKGQEYLDLKALIRDAGTAINETLEPFTGYGPGSLEAPILAASLREEWPASFTGTELSRLPDVMKLYLTHNRSVLTDTTFLGFPFHYFYTAVFLLILFVVLCIVYNRLIEWRLNKEGIVE